MIRTQNGDGTFGGIKRLMKGLNKLLNLKKSMNTKKAKCKTDVWDRIEEHMNSPDYIKAVYEFIRATS